MERGDNTFSVGKAEESSGFLMWKVSTLWQREIRKTLEPHDLTHSQFVLLASAYWLALNDVDVTQAVLSSHTKIDPMTTSTVLRTLQRKGFVRRDPHRSDTRAKIVGLTETGVAAVKQAVIAVESFDREFFSRLGGELPRFNAFLVSLLD